MRKILSIGLLLGLVACGSSTQPVEEQPVKEEPIKKSVKDTITRHETSKGHEPNHEEYKTPIWGDRKMIVGDFNGDKKMDTLREHFRINGEDAPKSYKEMKSYHEQVEYIMNNDAHVSLEGDGLPSIVAKGTCSGIVIIENVGDLDKDGNDEIGVVLKHADFSNLNTYHIYSSHDGEWTERLQLDFHELMYYKDHLDEGKMVTLNEDGTWHVKVYISEVGDFVEKDTTLISL